MNRIQNYFNLLAQRIEISSGMAGSSSSHGPDIGVNREILVNQFLEKHLPKRFSASLGGQIIGIDGSESKQIDIIVSSDIGVRFEENNRTFITTEGVAAAITVKSYLNKCALTDCLLNLASIPQADKKVLIARSWLGDDFDELIKRHPSLFIFAYNGINVQTCLEHVYNFYQNNKDIPENRYPEGILVNKDYYIKYTKFDARTNSGTIIPAGTFYPMMLKDGMWSYPLLDMLSYISTYISWLPKIRIDFYPYFNLAFGFEVD